MTVTVRGLDGVIKNLKAFDRLSISGHVLSDGADQGYGRYEGYVQSARGQAAYNSHWQTDDDAVEFAEPKIAKMVDDSVGKIVSSGSGDLKDAMDDALKLVYEFMTDYPPKPSGSRYTRTETLKNSYRYERL